MGVNLRAKTGVKNVHNIIDGMEGEMVKDPKNVFHGKRMKNVGRTRECPGPTSSIRSGCGFPLVNKIAPADDEVASPLRVIHRE